MYRIKFTTVSTGTGGISIDVPSGYDSLSGAYIQPPAAVGFGYTPYVLLDADGVSWEAGYGYQYGGTFERTFVIDSSSGAGTAINLSAGTHTVLFPDGGLQGRVAQIIYIKTAQSVGAGADQPIVFDSVGLAGVDGAADLPGANAPALPASMDDIIGILPYCRGVRFQLAVTCNTSQAGFLYARITDDDYIIGDAASVVIPTDFAGTKKVTGTAMTPIIKAVPPIIGSNSLNTYGYSSVKVYNSGAGAIDVDLRLIGEYYL